MIILKTYQKILVRMEAFKKHPLTKDNVGTALFKYCKFHIYQILYPKTRIYTFFGGLKFYAKRGEAGIVANVYYTLFDYEELMFLIHHLKKNDLFVDIGANVGHFSLLAAGICKAAVISIEPVPETFQKLNNNISLNKLDSKVQTLNVGVAEQNGTLKFTDGSGVMNSVSTDSNGIEVEVKTLDDILYQKSPRFLKIDVEGYEYFVLKGAKHVLKNPDLKFIIIKFNFSVSKYGHENSEIFEILTNHNFVPIAYNVVTKEFKEMDSFNTDKFNTIFILK